MLAAWWPLALRHPITSKFTIGDSLEIRTWTIRIFRTPREGSSSSYLRNQLVRHTISVCHSRPSSTTSITSSLEIETKRVSSQRSKTVFSTAAVDDSPYHVSGCWRPYRRFKIQEKYGHHIFVTRQVALAGWIPFTPRSNHRNVQKKIKKCENCIWEHANMREFQSILITK